MRGWIGQRPRITPKRWGLRGLVPGALVLALAGCTTLSDYVHNGFKVGPNYQRPPAPVAKDWIDGNDKRVRKETDDLSKWWTVFKDPALDSLIQTAYRQNLTLRQAGFRVLAARAKLGIAVGNIFPQTQQMIGDYRRNAVSRNAANREFLPKRWFSQWDYGFNLAWEVDFWGRFRRAIEQADDLLDASVENYDDVLVTLLGDVANDYVLIRTLQQQIVYLKANVELQRQSLVLATARFKGGQATELDVDQAQSTLSQTEAQIPETEIQLRQTANALCVLLGIPPEDLVAKLGTSPIPTAPPEVAVGIPADLVRRRPDVRRDERLAASQCAAIGIAEADFYPAISLSSKFGWSAEHLDQLLSPGSFTGFISPSFQWEILNYGRILNNVRLQDARFQELVLNYQNTVLTAGKEVEDGLATFLKAQVRARYLAESVKAASKAADLVLVQYKGGLVDFNRVSLVQQNLVQQQNLLAQAQGEIAQGLIAIYKALGGGWEIRCQPEDGATPTANAPPAAAPIQPGELLPVPKPVPNPAAPKVDPKAAVQGPTLSRMEP